MTLDLLAILGGRRVVPAAKPAKGDTVSVLRCECGSTVGSLARFGGESWLWRDAYRHTPAGAEEIVIDAALDDFEVIADVAASANVAGEWESEEVAATLADELDAISQFFDRPSRSFASVLPVLEMPASLGKVSGVGRWVEDYRATHDGRAPRMNSMVAGCRTCRTVLYCGDALAQLERHPDPPKTAVVTARPDMGVQRMGYSWPPEARPGRVVLYRSLSALLP